MTDDQPIHLVTDADGIPVAFTGHTPADPVCHVPWCVATHTHPDEEPHTGAVAHVTNIDPDTGETTAAAGVQLIQAGDRFAPFIRLFIWGLDDGSATYLLDRAEALYLADALTRLATHL